MKKSGPPEMASQPMPTPRPLASPTQERSISATPPPAAVELMFHSSRPASMERAASTATWSAFQSSGSIRARSRSSESDGTCTSVAVTIPALASNRAEHEVEDPPDDPAGDHSGDRRQKAEYRAAESD